MLTNAKHTLAHVTYTPLVLTYADRTCALANLDILEMDAIVQRQVLLIVSKTYKRVFCLIQTCMALGWKSESLFQTCDANVSADASLAVQIQGFTRFNHPDANADASVTARNEKFFLFSWACICICIRFSHLWAQVTQMQTQGEKTQVPSIPCHHGTVQTKKTSKSSAISVISCTFRQNCSSHVHLSILKRQIS